MKEKEIYNVIKCRDDKTVETVYEGVYIECLSYCLNKLDQYKNQRFDLKIIKKGENEKMKEKEFKDNGINMKCRNSEYQGLIDYIDDVRDKCSDNVYNNTIENNTTGTKYIVEYAPIINNGYSKQDLKTMVIISDLTKDEVAETIRSNVNKANADKSWFNGIYLSVQTVEEFLKTIPTYKL